MTTKWLPSALIVQVSYPKITTLSNSWHYCHKKSLSQLYNSTNILFYFFFCQIIVFWYGRSRENYPWLLGYLIFSCNSHAPACHLLLAAFSTSALHFTYLLCLFLHFLCLSFWNMEEDNHQRVCPHLCANPPFPQTLFPPPVSLLQPLNSSSSFNPVLNRCLHFKFSESYFMQPLVPFSHLYLRPQLFSTGEAWEGKASTYHFPLCRPFSSPKGILTTTHQIGLQGIHWDTRLTTLSSTNQKPQKQSRNKRLLCQTWRSSVPTFFSLYFKG